MRRGRGEGERGEGKEGEGKRGEGKRRREGRRERELKEGRGVKSKMNNAMGELELDHTDRKVMTGMTGTDEDI